ncbi:MAG: SRPBCC family protein [Bacteroidota bacterium]
MTTANKTVITIESTITAPVEKVWKLWSTPTDICKWNSPSPDWHTPFATNDLRVGGRFSSRMEAKDGSMGFDFGGTYDEVKTNETIAYTMDDNRTAKINFEPKGASTKVTIAFDAEEVNSIEMQRGGWQAILDNFKKYAENN